MSSTGAGARGPAGVRKAAVKHAGRAAVARRPANARDTAALRMRRHMLWGKRHVDKLGEDAFQQPARSSSVKAANTMGYVITKVALHFHLLHPPTRRMRPYTMELPLPRTHHIDWQGLF